MKKVYETSTLIDAELARVRLRTAGIRSMMEGADSGLRGPATPISVWVKPADAKRAAELIAKANPPKKAAKPASPRRPASRALPRDFRRILVALDGTPEAERVLPWLPRFAPGARLILATASRPLYLSGPDGMVAALPPPSGETLAYLKKVAARIRPRPEIVATAGPPAIALLEEARRRRADAVALATRGGEALLRRVVGGMTEMLLHGGELPVFVVPSGARAKSGRLRTVAVPLDGTPAGDAVLRVVTPWALRAKAEVVLLHALEGLDELEKVAARASLKGAAAVGRTAERYLARAKARFEGLAARLRGNGVRARAEFTRGPQPECLIRAAESAGAEFMAISQKAHGALRHLWSGSPASRLVQASRMPVLLLRARGK